MILSEISIKRPVLATVMSLLILLVGAVSYDRLTVREYPKIDVPVVTVETNYPGASSSIIETQVTQIIEDSLSGIEGVDYISSVSRSGKSQITVTFKLTRDPDDAASDVRDRVGRVRGALPDDVEEPITAKTEADAQPVFWLALSSDNHSMMEISQIADKMVKDPLQTVDGVANVMLFGDRRFAMRIWLDPARMAAYQVIPQDIENALRSQNVEIPAGRIESDQREFSVLAKTDLNTVGQFEDIIIRNDNNYAVRVRDVARVEIAPEDERRKSRFKGKSAVALGVVKQSTANPLDVSNGIQERLPQITAALPEGVNVEIAYDSSIFISESIKSVFKTIFEASVLVIAVIFFFLRNLRATLIPVITIPLSLIGSFALMLAMGFSINTLTLLAMVLAIGLVVDDAIVMLENIYRHVEEGLSPIQAAFKGSKEIGFAVIATTLTLVAVFAPVAFTPGRTGKLFTEFALTLAGGVLVSGFIALSLSPMMCSRLLHHEKRHSAIFNLIEGWILGLTNGYQSLLKKVLRSRLLAVLIMAVSLGGAGLLYTKLPQELAPVEDRGTILAMSISPDGASVDYVDRYAKQVEGMIAKQPSGNRYFTIVGFPTETNSMTFLGLKPWDERTQKQQSIVAELTPQLFGGVTGTMSFAMNPPSLGQSFVSRPVEFIIKSNTDYAELKTISDQLMARILKNPGFVQPDIDLKLNKPELSLNVNRDKASEMGLDINLIGRSIETYMASRNVTRFKKEGEQYDVILQVEPSQRRSPSDLSNLYLRTNDNTMVQLSSVVDINESVAPKELNHFDKMKSVKFQAILAPGYSLKQALDFLEQQMAEISPETLYDFGGQSREFKESGSGLMVTAILALIFTFLVLAAQFESFRNPMIIMLSVPPALFGGLFALYFSGGSLSIYSQIGLITLIGLITKHGILIVEFANQLQDQGRELQEAIIESATMRLRPILMTTGAMVLGTVPLAVAFGAGAESRQQIGWVIVGGLTFGTLLTLFIVPTVYSYLGRRLFKKVEPDYQLMEQGSEQ
ncbi:efflux RND transporter permease subunit [Amphritea pacifica]|uniref:Efflux RND transporter permease subunit n=1 Tax=Amphritea pacifica TaxID=2811233 RepID=A0ABS2W9X8_9GAMM|nr:efflux RND transporter permease subunit [Amphritea pacifica]MBN0988520.1 efflux RND transporter permease subunit [Amphritea pacifica]MBN1008393.1 efflux RND transporter permease subunit [Amphritea pacifica]